MNIKVIMEFDNVFAADIFMCWWLNSGEQLAHFHTTDWNLKRGYLRVEGSGIEEEEEDED